MFTNDGKTLLQLLFNKTYQLLQITVPATNITFFQLFVGCLVTVFVIKLISLFMGISLGTSAPSLHDSIRNREKKR